MRRPGSAPAELAGGLLALALQLTSGVVEREQRARTQRDDDEEAHEVVLPLGDWIFCGVPSPPASVAAAGPTAMAKTSTNALMTTMSFWRVFMRRNCSVVGRADELLPPYPP